MRYTHYSRCIIETNQVERLPFAPEHYAQAEVACVKLYITSPNNELAGIPELQALRLVDKWNSRGLKYIYWLNGG